MKIKVSFTLEIKEFIPLFVIRNKVKVLETENLKIYDIETKDYFKEYAKKRRF